MTKFYDEVTEMIAYHHSLTEDDAQLIIDSLCLTSTDREYLYRHPENLAPFDGDSADRTCGSFGWVVWFETNDTAISITNGAPVHHEHVYSLDDAVETAQN